MRAAMYEPSLSFGRGHASQQCFVLRGPSLLQQCRFVGEPMDCTRFWSSYLLCVAAHVSFCHGHMHSTASPVSFSGQSLGTASSGIMGGGKVLQHSLSHRRGHRLHRVCSLLGSDLPYCFSWVQQHISQRSLSWKRPSPARCLFRICKVMRSAPELRCCVI